MRAPMLKLALAAVLPLCVPHGGSARETTMAAVRYQLTYNAPGSAAAHVRMDIPGAAPAQRTLLIPRAVPMGYGDQPYDSFVANVVAFDAKGARLDVARADGPRWRVGLAVRVEYDVDVARMEREIQSGTDSSRVRLDYAFFLGYSVFGLIQGEEGRPIDLKIDAPKGWPVFSTLAPAAASPGSLLRADNFYALADSQIALGPALHVSAVHYQREKQAPLWLAYYSEAPVDAARLEKLSGEAMTAISDYFDGSGPPPFPRFTVFLEFLKPVTPKHGYGFGMEHLETFHAALAAADADPATLPDGRLRYHIAHHVAHAWIPKRCYGEGYYPFSWAASPKIDTIWFSEGFGQYAAIVALADLLERTPEKQEELRQQIVDRRFRSVLAEASPELKRMPLRELSLLASKEYAVDFRIGQLTFARGGLMAAEMDDVIRSKTHGTKSLRDALRALIAWSAANKRAFRAEELPEIFRQATGVDVKPVMEKWLAPLD